MAKVFTLIILCSTLIFFKSEAQEEGTFTNVTKLAPVRISTNTEHKPQSKVWKYACNFWAVLPDSEGTHVWRLDGTEWTKVFTVSADTYGKADCKVVGDVVHIVLFRGGNTTSHLVSVEYVPVDNTYRLWSRRPSAVAIQQLRGAATIDIDSKGRMWMAANGLNENGISEVNVRWSDFPYADWSSPILLESDINFDDICAVVALRGKIGIMWSNQTTQRFGFKTHVDGADPTKWSADEVPASQSALDIGAGIADDHVNLAVARDGTLYCAVKTNYDKWGYPKIALLVRKPSGTWDNLYKISETGTRPIVILNEKLGKLLVIYTSTENGGDILYKESSVSDISFSSVKTLISGFYDNATSTKDNYETETVILASNNTHAPGVLLSTASDGVASVPCNLNLVFDVYPNPFSERATIHFILPQGGEYTLSVYDVTGAHITDLSNDKAEAGELYTLYLEGEWLSTGLYMLRLQAPGVNEAIKLIHQQ